MFSVILSEAKAVQAWKPATTRSSFFLLRMTIILLYSFVTIGQPFCRTRHL